MYCICFALQVNHIHCAFCLALAASSRADSLFHIPFYLKQQNILHSFFFIGTETYEVILFSKMKFLPLQVNSVGIQNRLLQWSLMDTDCWTNLPSAHLFLWTGTASNQKRERVRKERKFILIAAINLTHTHRKSTV